MSSGRTLVLLRHTKAERPDGLADIDRSLTDRGHADAGAAGAWLAAAGYAPDLVICSPAKRTRQTWHGVAVAMAGATPLVRYERQAYDGSAQDLLDLVRHADDKARTVLLIGHNPSVSDLSALLDPTTVDGDSDGLRTGGVAVHTVTGSWTECGPRLAPLTATHTARA
jgi:phosphohistidine phosphatase